MTTSTSTPGAERRDSDVDRVAVPQVSPAVGRAILAGLALPGGWLGFRLIGGSASELSDLWIANALYLIAVALAGAAPSGRRRAEAAANIAVVSVGFVVGGALAGVDVLRLLWMAVANLAAAAVLVAVYRGRGADRSWVPRRAGEVVWLTGACVPATIVGALLGAYPGSGPEAYGDVHCLLWAAARQFSLFAVACHCVLPVLFQPVRRLLRAPAPAQWPPFLVAAVLCQWVPRVQPDLPLSWLYVVPAIWAGLLLPVRGAGLAALAINLPFVVLPYPHFAHHPDEALLSPQLLTDVTQGFLAHVAVLLAVFRENLLDLRDRADERVEAERVRRELLDAVVESLTHGLVLVHPDGRVALENAAARGLVGTIPDRVTAAWARQIDLQAADVRRVLDAERLAAILAPPDGRLVTQVSLPGAGGPRRVALSSQCVDTGTQRLSLMLLKDVTAAHERQQQLEAFAGTVAHDLKGPLSALTGWMAAADEEFADEEPDNGLAMLRRAQDAVGRMRGLIDDYPAHAVSRGGVLTPVEVPLARVVADVVAFYAPDDGRSVDGRSVDGRTDHTGPSFEVDCPHVVAADESLTRRLLANLVGNAIKYARPGERPELRITSRVAGPEWIEVAVADRGRGLQPGDEERIFAGFSRSAKDAAAVEGIGLGLAVCHAIVTRHGGVIQAANNPGGGAVFRFTLPAWDAP